MVRRSTVAFVIAVSLLALVAGGTAVYFALSIPNDIAAERLFREARDLIKQKDTTGANERLRKIVREYPRTDAAASASVLLFQLSHDRHEAAQKSIKNLEKQVVQQKAEIVT